MALRSLADVLRDAPHRAQLEAMRDFLAEALEHAPPREQAPIAAQLRAVLADLDAMPLDEGRSTVDDLARRRADRRTRASAS